MELVKCQPTQDPLRACGFSGEKTAIASWVSSKLRGTWFYDRRVPEAHVTPYWVSPQWEAR
ncbi:hypothetical protein SS33_25730 [Enterobacter kobei]|nr:hypothetical protein SS33_25730 [Enterobacter kobei]